MRAGGRSTAKPTSDPSVAQGADHGPLMSRLLIGFVIVFLVASVVFAGRSLLENWLIEQDYYLTAGEVVPFPLATMSWMSSAKVSATSRPTIAAAVDTHLGTSPTLQPGDAAVVAPMQPAAAVRSGSPAPTSISTSPAPSLAAATLVPEPRPESPPAPARIQIPALEINRPIIPLAQVTGQSAGAPTWKTKELFRSGGKDRIGHSEGSANPGEERNMVLVGSAYRGVFVRLKRLKPGREVHVINDTGETFTYKVKTIKKVKLRGKNSGDSTQHLDFLSAGDSERLTLVGCIAAGAEACFERIYVVAQPVK